MGPSSRYKRGSPSICRVPWGAEVPGCCGVLGSVVECCGVCCCMWWLVTSTPKSHLNSKKVTSTPKSQKKSKKNPKTIFFFGPFCYKNVEKMFYPPQKVTLSPQKVKKVKKNFLELRWLFGVEVTNQHTPQHSPTLHHTPQHSPTLHNTPAPRHLNHESCGGDMLLALLIW